MHSQDGGDVEKWTDFISRFGQQRKTLRTFFNEPKPTYPNSLNVFQCDHFFPYPAVVLNTETTGDAVANDIGKHTKVSNISLDS